MKKFFLLMLMLAEVIALNSCETTDPHEYDAVIQNILETEDVAVFTVGNYLVLTGIDDMTADEIEGYPGEFSNHRTQIFTISPGIHSVNVRYKKDKSSSMSTVALFAKFEKGKRYKVMYKLIAHSLYYDIIDEETSASVLLGLNILH